MNASFEKWVKSYHMRDGSQASLWHRRCMTTLHTAIHCYARMTTNYVTAYVESNILVKVLGFKQ